MSNVVFLNFGAEPQNAVGSIQELRTDYSKMKKKNTHEHFKLDETGGYFSKRVENTLEKGDIALYDQISISHCVFKYFYLQKRKNKGLFRIFFHFCGSYSQEPIT